MMSSIMTILLPYEYPSPRNHAFGVGQRDVRTRDVLKTILGIWCRGCADAVTVRDDDHRFGGDY